MTQKEMQLLLIDLCARLPYGVKIDREWIAPMSGSPEHSIMEFDTFDIEVIKTSIELGEEGNYRDGKMQGLTICDDGKNHFVRGYMCKPYLRSMSSMTEAEREEWADLFNLELDKLNEIDDEDKAEELAPYYFGKSHQVSIDWLNAHHFDYHNLIPMGLALEAPEDMYKTE